MSSFGASDRRKLVIRLLRFYGQVCFYCSDPLSVEDATVDHYIPRAAGGSNSFDNLRPACFACNNDKADRIPLPDGTLPPRVKRLRLPKAERPSICTACRSGRDLLPGSRCVVCGVGAMPLARPQQLKAKTWECDHKINWCIGCCLATEEERAELGQSNRLVGAVA